MHDLFHFWRARMWYWGQRLILFKNMWGKQIFFERCHTWAKKGEWGCLFYKKLHHNYWRSSRRAQGGARLEATTTCHNSTFVTTSLTHAWVWVISWMGNNWMYEWANHEDNEKNHFKFKIPCIVLWWSNHNW